MQPSWVLPLGSVKLDRVWITGTGLILDRELILCLHRWCVALLAIGCVFRPAP